MAQARGQGWPFSRLPICGSILFSADTRSTQSVESSNACLQPAQHVILDLKCQTFFKFALRGCQIGVTMGPIDLEESQEIEETRRYHPDV